MDSEKVGAAPHVPVMLKEVIAGLDVRPGGRWIDATIGAGGHSEAILQASSPDGRLLGLDADEDALALTRERLAPFLDRVILKHSNFRELEYAARWEEFAPVDGVLMDLGVSSMQLDLPGRGFSFMHEAPLDMRMDRSTGVGAAGLIKSIDEHTLSSLLRDLGEEPRHRQIARAIVTARAKRPIRTTADLAGVVESVSPRTGKTHPATRVFQALRIAVNDELKALEDALPQALAVLRPGGRLAVISFHSLEDRMVKQFLAALANPCICPPDLPVCGCGRTPTVRLISKQAVMPGPDEIAANSRSRSARLRVAEKLREGEP